MPSKSQEAFLIYKSIWEALKFFSPEQIGRLFVLIFDYQITGAIKEEEKDKDILPIFNVMKNQFRLDETKYTKRQKINRKNGQLGGRPKNPAKTQANPSCIAGFSCETEKTLNDNVNENDNDNEKGKVNEKEKAKNTPSALGLKKPPRALVVAENNPIDILQEEITTLLGEQAWFDFRAMRNRLKAPISITAAKMLLTSLEKHAGVDADRRRKVIGQSIANGWKGFFELKEGGRQYGAPKDITAHNREVLTRDMATALGMIKEGKI